MSQKNIKLYQACIERELKLFEIAGKVGIESTRFSKILNGKLTATVEEKQRLSKFLRKPQKDLF